MTLGADTTVTSAMILAAGRGERMRPVTDRLPKPLVRVGDKPLIQYHVERLATAGIANIVINLAWLGAQIRDLLGDGARFGVHIQYSDEGDAALETGGGIHRALPLLGPRPFWVISADIWTTFVFTNTAARLADMDLAHLVLVPNPDFHPHGDFHLRSGRVTEVVGERLTYANIALFRPELFAACGPGRYSFVPLLRTAIAQGRVSGESFAGRWHNVGTVAQLQELNDELAVVR